MGKCADERAPVSRDEVSTLGGALLQSVDRPSDDSHDDETPATGPDDLGLLDDLRRVIALLEPPPAHGVAAARGGLACGLVAALLP